MMTFRGGFTASVILTVVAFYGCADSGGAANDVSAGDAGKSQTAGESTGATSNGGSGAPGGKSSGGAPGEAGAFGELAGLGGVAETGGASGAAAGGGGTADGGVSGESAGVAGAAGSPSVPNDCSRDVDCGSGYHCTGTAAQLCFVDPSWQCTRPDECVTGSVDRACGKDQHCQPRGSYGDACGNDLPRCDDNWACNPDTATCDDPTDVNGGFDKFFCLGGYCDVGDFCRTITGQSACAPIFMDMTGYTCDEKADCGPYFSCTAQYQCKISSAVCTKDTDCGAKEFCSAQFGKRCFPLGGAGASCTANTQCLPTAYCDGSTKKCAWYPLEGEPCQQGHCGPELACGPGFIGGHCEQN